MDAVPGLDMNQLFIRLRRGTNMAMLMDTISSDLLLYCTLSIPILNKELHRL